MEQPIEFCHFLARLTESINGIATMEGKRRSVNPKPHVIPDIEEDFPFDEQSFQRRAGSLTQSQPFYFQVRALAKTQSTQPLRREVAPDSVKTTQVESSLPKQTTSVLESLMDPTLHSRPSICLPRNSVTSTDQNRGSVEDVTTAGADSTNPARNTFPANATRVPHPPHSQGCLSVTTIGPSKYQVYRTALPDQLVPFIHPIIVCAEQHARRLPQGWRTNLYSLTKQDLPLAHIPGGKLLVQPLTDHVVYLVQQLYAPLGSNNDSSVPVIRMDSNQPHILKYDENHSGVALHYDRCDVTVQLMLSDSNDYEGGGTYFGEMDTMVRLERAELLLHPGSLVHAGRDITKGSRQLMVWFIHMRQPL